MDAMVHRMTQLERLEAESIFIIREVAAEFDNPVMLYSIGKDSSVLLHLARKAFYPGRRSRISRSWAPAASTSTPRPSRFSWRCRA
jgi:3'-phosphoadenosine 5'-phosphosulfate sulfotransferase (PAPS reductase)/FAD synthetase